jgi:hypothetical protein
MRLHPQMRGRAKSHERVCVRIIPCWVCDRTIDAQIEAIVQPRLEPRNCCLSSLATRARASKAGRNALDEGLELRAKLFRDLDRVGEKLPIGVIRT